MNRGTLFLVVGPSGAGKDTVIRAARAALGPTSDIVFARRVITRAGADATEDHEPVDGPTFAARRAAGGFMLCWHAHGIDYGIPAGHEADLAAGRHVVANVSRGVIAEAARRFGPVRVIEITAPRAVLAARLKARGRENGAAVGERLARAVPIPQGVPVTRIVNDGPIEGARDAFAAALRAR